MNEMEKLVIQIRRDIVRMVNAVNSGHPGGSLGCTEFFVTLFFKILKEIRILAWTVEMKIYSFYQMDISLRYTTVLLQSWIFPCF